MVILHVSNVMRMRYMSDTDETIPHVLLQYTMYNQLRQQLIHDINNIIPNTNLSIQLLLMSDDIITNIRHKLCVITGQYLVDGLHNRTRAIYNSQNEQANEINDDQ